jgi:hypothetical protein
MTVIRGTPWVSIVCRGAVVERPTGGRGGGAAFAPRPGRTAALVAHHPLGDEQV